LAKGPVVGEHPDADLLTAFVEQGLPERERRAVFAHLAQCADCRDVVSLATPLLDVPSQVVPVGKTWLGWPALRWSAAAACAVVVVAAVGVYQRSGRMASYREAPPQLAIRTAETATLQKDSHPANGAIAENRDAEQKAAAELAKPAEVASAAPRQAVVRARPVSPAPAAPPAAADKVALDEGKLAAAPARMAARSDMAGSAAPMPSQMNEQVEVSSEAAVVSTQSAEENPGKAKQVLQDNLATAANRLAKNEPAARMAAMAPSALKKLTPRWTLASDGTLERSLDGGKSWKAIPVAPDTTLTAVAAMDSDIWVGGSHGALYHSTDAGDHWTQVNPTTGGQPLTANIIGIEFADALHGKITTANQQMWTTSDGGRSWQETH